MNRLAQSILVNIVPGNLKHSEKTTIPKQTHPNACHGPSNSDDTGSSGRTSRATNTTTTKLLEEISEGANKEPENQPDPNIPQTEPHNNWNQWSCWSVPVRRLSCQVCSFVYSQNLKFRGCYWWCIRCVLEKFDFWGVTDCTICYWFLSTTCLAAVALLSQLK